MSLTACLTGGHVIYVVYPARKQTCNLWETALSYEFMQIHRHYYRAIDQILYTTLQSDQSEKSSSVGSDEITFLWQPSNQRRIFRYFVHYLCVCGLKAKKNVIFV